MSCRKCGLGNVALCRSEGFGFVETSHRVVVPQRVSSTDSISDGVESVRPAVCQEVRLDDFADEEVMVPWTPTIQCDLKWWYDTHHLLAGASLLVPQLDLLFWSDASEQGWGTHMLDHFVSGLWSPEERALSINLRELRAIRLGLLHFRHLIVGLSIGVFLDNTTALSYVCKQGGTLLSPLNRKAQLLLRWAESLPVSLVPQFVMGSRNVVADSLSRRNQVIGSEWTLHQDVVNDLLRRWPATADLFATSLNYRLPAYFSPINDPLAADSDAFLQLWDDMRAYAFPLFALVREVLNKVVSSQNILLTLMAPWWPRKE